MEKVKYIYINSHVFSSAVYQTQVIDWLHLYAENGLTFELVHQFYINPLNIKFHRDQKRQIRKAYQGEVRFQYVHQNYQIFRFSNKLINLFFFLGDIITNDKIVFFSRADIGREIGFLKKLFGRKIVFYYDLRGANVDEAINIMKTKGSYSKREYRKIADTAYGEYIRQLIADKVFCVSNALMKYQQEEYHADISKYVLYPCLSKHSKFYFDESLRDSKRQELGFSKDDNVYVYSGGVGNVWHVPDAFLRLFRKIADNDNNAKMLVLTFKATEDLYKLVESDPILNNRVKVFEAIPNDKIVGYLNAADFGVLLRENRILNNVASPSKYAEYMLCGLPTIISESVHDYADYCRKYQTGIVLSNYDFEHLEQADVAPLKKEVFDRKNIALIAANLLSKESAAQRIVKELRTE